MNKNNATSVFSFDSQTVRTLDLNGEIWFVASDVAQALEYRDSHNMVRSLDEDEKGTHIMSTPGGDQELLVISESGLYSAVLKSRKAEAKRFKRWVTHEVLPSIRITGKYAGDGAIILSQAEAVNLAGLLQLIPMFEETQKRAEAMMREAKSPFAAKMYDAWHETGLFAWTLRDLGRRCIAAREDEDRLMRMNGTLPAM